MTDAARILQEHDLADIETIVLDCVELDYDYDDDEKITNVAMTLGRAKAAILAQRVTEIVDRVRQRTS